MTRQRTISIPYEVGERMKRFRANWSAIASEAFTRRMDELEAALEATRALVPELMALRGKIADIPSCRNIVQSINAVIDGEIST